MKSLWVDAKWCNSRWNAAQMVEKIGTVLFIFRSKSRVSERSARTGAKVRSSYRECLYHLKGMTQSREEYRVRLKCRCVIYI